MERTSSSVGKESRRGASELNGGQSLVVRFTSACRRIIGTRSSSKSQGRTPDSFLFCSNGSMCCGSMESDFFGGDWRDGESGVTVRDGRDWNHSAWLRRGQLFEASENNVEVCLISR